MTRYSAAFAVAVVASLFVAEAALAAATVEVLGADRFDQGAVSSPTASVTCDPASSRLLRRSDAHDLPGQGQQPELPRGSGRRRARRDRMASSAMERPTRTRSRCGSHPSSLTRSSLRTRDVRMVRAGLHSHRPDEPVCVAALVDRPRGQSRSCRKPLVSRSAGARPSDPTASRAMRSVRMLVEIDAFRTDLSPSTVRDVGVYLLG